MKMPFVKTGAFLLLAALAGCAGCKKKEPGTALPAPAEEAAGAEEAAKAEEPGEAPPDEDIKNVFWSQVAGRFYPMLEDEVESMVSKYLGDASKVEKLEGRDILGFISPHAGYVYSGPVAAWGYKQLEGRPIHTVVILGFNHSGSPSTSCILPYEGYKTPLGVVPVDGEVRDELLEKGSGILKASKAPFMGEHSLETQLPFIQKVLPNASIVPIMAAHPGGKVDEALADLLFETLGKRRDVVFVASTDLCHYLPYDDAVETDRETLKWIADLDWEKVAGAGIGANRICGYFTVGILMKILERYETEGKEGTLVKYANSGDTSGDRSSGVVGYGIVAFSLPEGVRTEESPGRKAKVPGSGKAPELSGEHRAYLEKTAALSIEAALDGNAYDPEAPEDELLERTMGSIVVIEVGGRIQGTGKELSLARPLFESVAEAAKRAVLEDTRYPAPAAEKLDEMKVKIYAVSGVEPIEEFSVEKMDGDGLILAGEWGEGILPPGEIAARGWKREAALKHACRRANLMINCYKEQHVKEEKITFTALKGAAL